MIPPRPWLGTPTCWSRTCYPRYWTCYTPHSAGASVSPTCRTITAARPPSGNRLGRHCVRGSPTPPGKCVFPADCTRRTRTSPRVRSAVVLPTVGDPRRIRSLQPVQPAVLSLTAGHPRRTHSLLPVQPAVLFTCGEHMCTTVVQ